MEFNWPCDVSSALFWANWYHDISVPLTAVEILKKCEKKTNCGDLKNLKYWKISIWFSDWLECKKTCQMSQISSRSFDECKIRKIPKEIFSKIPNRFESNKSFESVADVFNFLVKKYYTTCLRNQKLILFLNNFLGWWITWYVMSISYVI